MRRDLSILRRLEKIEKEIGYCEIKLEKEQRLQTQSRFMQMHIAGLREAISGFRELRSGETGDGNLLGGVTLREVFRCVSQNEEIQYIDGLRSQFRCTGALPFLEEEGRALRFDVEDLERRLESFEAFRNKRARLLDERARSLSSFHRDDGQPLREISAEFERSEQTWNTLTEDLMNADEAIFHISRAADYLSSARNFILSSRSQFRIDEWLRTGYLIDLFKHSTIGRAKEMVEGADRNLKRALMELLCLEDYEIATKHFENMLLPFLDALFEDLFANGRLQGSLKFLERRLDGLQQLKRRLEATRESIFSCQRQEEQNRVRLFNKIGDERKKLTQA